MAALIVGDVGRTSVAGQTAARGSYSLGTFTGVVAAGVTGDLFQFRWADTTRVAVIRRVVISAVASTPFGATPASAPQFHLYKANSWTVQGTGGFAVNPIATNSRRTTMPTTLVATGDTRISNTAALGAGTKTIADPPLVSLAGVPVSANTCPVLAPTDMLNFLSSETDYPLVLATNEGFVVNLISDPGTGTMIFGVTVDWFETVAI